MIKNEISFRVRYAETDRMGFVYYGNYAAYLEMGRVELLRSVGMSYRALEDQGVLLPVRDFSIQYRQAALYDDLLTLETSMTELPETRIHFTYVLRNDVGLLLTTANTTLIFVDQNTSRPIRCPKALYSLLAPFFTN